MTARYFLSCIVVALLVSTRSLSGQGPAALDPIVGRWQSDTTNGSSALSDCRRTPQGGAVLCEQTVTTPGGIRHVEGLFTFDPATSHYFLYVEGSPEDTLKPVPIAIAGKVWTYGGVAPAPNGKWWRTINDFPGGSSYTWRLESSDDGTTWTRVMGGSSKGGAPAADLDQSAGAEALRAIVGTWQSDTTAGHSARSVCVQTPAHRAVLCEQAISAPDGVHHALDLFTSDPATGKHVFYLVRRPGEALDPVTLTITGGSWTYGGDVADPDGSWSRTVNDFPGGGTYSWTFETSADGKNWTKVAGGMSRLVE